MTKTEFAGFIREHGPVILDGATGTNLMEAGMPIGVCPESWVLENPQVLLDLQRRYVEAGSHIVYASTFTGNRIKLEEYGLQERLEEINTQLVALSRQAVGDQALVAGDMTMTGQQLFPMGELLFEELVDVYKEQASVLAKAGVDLFVVETMMSLQECRAAVIAIREVCDLPIMVTLTYNEDGRTLFGTPPETAVVVLQSLGVDAIGVNCSTGPMEMVPLVERMAEYATIPLIAKPNAGLPELEGKKTVYRMTPEEFAGAGVALVKAGAAIVGGCCGTTEKHIKALSDATRGMELHRPLASHRRILASERKNVEVGLDGNFLVVGERINPTGKKKLQAQLREGKLDLVREMAMAQEENGAAILDINMGMNGIDEKEMMKQVIYEVAATVDCPLCLDTSHIDVMEEALRVYPGRALINSVSLETEKIEHMLPLAKKYGAMFVLLPLSDEGLPKDAKEKHEIIDTVYDRAMELGMAHEDIVVDGLVATIGANPEAAKECYDTISYCKDIRKLPTICGLSNISFGLPERSFVNTAFLTMAICRGLTMAIANPSQELLMNAAFASDMLLHRPDSDIRYIERMNKLAEEKAKYETVVVKKEGAAGGTASVEEKADPVTTAVLKGNKGTIIDEVKKSPNFDILISREDACLIEDNHEAFVNHIVNVMQNTTKIVDDLSKIEGPFLKIAICNMIDDTKVIMQYLEHLQEMFGAEIKVVTSGNIWIDFIAPGTNKGAALSNLMKLFHVKPEECMAFGDQQNDLEMLELVGHSYAMSNSAPGVSYYADEVTDSVEDVLEDVLASLDK